MIIGNHWITRPISGNTAKCYWPDEIVSNGVTAAQMALKEGASSYGDTQLWEALFFAGYDELGYRLRDATQKASRLETALDVSLGIELGDVDPDEEVATTGNLTVDAPHVAVLRKLARDARSVVAAVILECGPIIEAAAAAGGASYSESQIIA